MLLQLSLVRTHRQTDDCLFGPRHTTIAHSLSFFLFLSIECSVLFKCTMYDVCLLFYKKHFWLTHIFGCLYFQSWPGVKHHWSDVKKPILLQLAPHALHQCHSGNRSILASYNLKDVAQIYIVDEVPGEFHMSGPEDDCWFSCLSFLLVMCRWLHYPRPFVRTTPHVCLRGTEPNHQSDGGERSVQHWDRPWQTQEHEIPRVPWEKVRKVQVSHAEVIFGGGDFKLIRKRFF